MTAKAIQKSGRGGTAAAYGFSLIELSMVILVLGCIIAVVSTGYQSYQSNRKNEITQQRVTDAAQKIYDFRKINGYYPCPAPLTAPRTTNPTYGKAPASCNTGTPGACAGGTCTQSSIRGGGGNVETGALPFRDLGISEADSYDAYGSRLTYAVTQFMTDKSTIREDSGGISVQDDSGADVFTPAGSGHFIVMSMGKNRMGGYGLEGSISTPCAGAQRDTDNCDFEIGAAPAQFRTASHSENTAGAEYFDDVVAFNVPEERAMWRKGLAEKGEDNDNIIDMAENKIIMSAQSAIANASAQLSILYDGSNPNYDGSLHIRQDPAVTSSGKLITNENCSVGGGGRCFRVSTLLPNCGPGEYVTGLYNGRFQCGKVFYGCKDASGAPDLTKYIKGINPDGTPKCEPIPPQSIDGACGTADGRTDLTGPPTSNFDLCNPGIPTSVTGTGSVANPYKWFCGPISAGGSTSPQCSARTSPPFDGICGNDNNLVLAAPPTQLCNQGNMNSFTTSTGGWNWVCAGEGNPHTDATCGATLLAPVGSCQPGP